MKTRLSVLKVVGVAVALVRHLYPARQRQSYAPRRLHHGAERYRSIAALFAVLLLVALSAATVSADPPGWQPVGAPGFTADPVSETELALDTSGTPYVAFREISWAEYKATVMRYNGTAWEVVGTRGFSDGHIQGPSLALDGAGTPYLAYTDVAHGQKATVMRYEGSTGTWEPVGAPGFSAGVATMPSLALDPNGVPYVAYQDFANGYKATVMRYNGADWEPVGIAGFSAGRSISPELAFDPDGVPYVAYQDFANGFKATVMRYSGNTWELVGIAGFSAGDMQDPSLALNSEGTPYVAYEDHGNGSRATVMRYNGANWEPVGLAGFTSTAASFVNVALDPDGVPYVAYTDFNARVNVMRYNGSAWETVGAPSFSAGYAYYVSLDLDAGGVPYVAYQDYGGYGSRATVMRYVSSVNAAPAADPGGPYLGAVNTAIQFDGSLSSDPDGDPLTYSWSFGDGSAGSGSNPTHTYTASGSYDVCLTVNDGSLDSAQACTLADVSDLNTAPVANPGGPYLGAVNTAIQFDGSLSTDPDGDPLTYSWSFGNGSTDTGPMPTYTYTASGVFTVCLTVNDDLASSDPACTLAVVYDPSAGFVTGGGWIDSPAGAYRADPTLSGKATFGFVAKYKKGEPVPSGNTAFEFDLAGMAFASQSYEWLVVNQGGTNAQFKGSGLINGAPDPNGNDYKFMLWAGDNSPDTFRIRIWWEDVAGEENDVYDNGVDQAIGAGNIVVHTGN